MSQTELGKEAGHSQQNIDHIEKGKAKKPQRIVTEIAAALRTTREWLLWEEGPREFGPQYLSTQKLVDKYKDLPANMKEAVSQFIEESARPKRPKRRTG
jgi:DNA-binding XRE family transcriptional regulator